MLTFSSPLSYSEADYEFFCPTRVTNCMDWGEIWHGRGDQKSILHAKFHLHQRNDKGIRAQN